MGIDKVERQRLSRWFSSIRSRYNLPVAALIGNCDEKVLNNLFSPDAALAQLVAIEKGVENGRFGYTDIGVPEKRFLDIKKKAIVVSLRVAYLELVKATPQQMAENEDIAAARFRFIKLDAAYVGDDVTIPELAGINSVEYERILANIASAESISKRGRVESSQGAILREPLEL